jgi:hypothetical protein
MNYDRNTPRSGGQARVIADNGPQFIAKDFEELIRQGGLLANGERPGLISG